MSCRSDIVSHGNALRRPNLRKWGDYVGPALAGLLAFSVTAAVAAEKPAPPERNEALKALTGCRAIADASARLACFDRAVADIDKAEAGGDIVIVDRKQARAARRRAFGFNFSELSIFDRATPKEEMDNLVAKIASAHRNSDGRWVIVLEDGAVWREIGDPEPNLQPVPGATARISRGSLGSFFIKIDGLSTHVHRDQ